MNECVFNSQAEEALFINCCIQKFSFFWESMCSLFCLHMCATRPSPEPSESSLYLRIAVPHSLTSSSCVAYPEFFKVLFHKQVIRIKFCSNFLLIPCMLRPSLSLAPWFNHDNFPTLMPVNWCPERSVLLFSFNLGRFEYSCRPRN